MSNAPTRLQELYFRYMSGNCSDAERKELFSLLSVADTEQEWHALIDGSFDADTNPHELSQQRAAAIFQVIRTNAGIEEGDSEMKITPAGNRRKAKIIEWRSRKWWAAASILLLAVAGIWKFNQEPGVTKATQPFLQQQEITGVQDHSGAVLTLADGKKLVLDSLSNGLISIQDGARVQLNENGLVYDQVNTNEPAGYNTMSTPPGRQFRLQLPDGTEVMLNAGSSIRYPVHFNGRERRVFVEGEAWFDVKKDHSKPFRVETGEHGLVEVLGTSFNIRCYQEEPVAKATLLSGKIRYSGNGVRKIIAPGQQLLQYKDGSMKLIASADTSQVMAWKNGEFSFQHLNLEEAIREIARWYNLEPVYTGKVPVFEFYGSISRGLTSQQVVRLLNNMGLHISIDQHKLIISP